MLRDCLAQALADVEASPLPGPKLSKKPWEAVVPNEGLCRSLRSLGYSSPFKVQSRLIRMLSQRNSLTITAPRRSGKTIGLLCSIFLSVDPTCESLQAIYFSPTQALIDEAFEIASQLFDGISISQELVRGRQVLFGTEGADLQAIDLGELRLLVLDNPSGLKPAYHDVWTLKGDFRVAVVFW
jgi:superfamily II DNA/RNA helicase